MKNYRIINLDERGEYSATIYNQAGSEVYNVDTESARELIEDGFMEHKDDLSGLADYLSDIGIIAAGARIEDGEPEA